MLPALPTGMASRSGASPRDSQISNAAVFCPAMRWGLTELTSETGCLAVRTRAAPSGVGSGAGARIAGARAHNGACPALERLRHGDNHAAVLERACGIAAFE